MGTTVLGSHILPTRQAESMDLLRTLSLSPAALFSNALCFQGLASGLLSYPYTHPIQVSYSSS